MNRFSFIHICLLLCLVVLGAPLALADGSETLGPPGISIATGNGIVAAGKGLSGTDGSATLTVAVPDGAVVKQVLLYWQGMATFGGAIDSEFKIGATDITGGTLISDPVFFNNEGDPKADQYSYVFRKDITSLGLVGPGVNNLSISGLNGFAYVTDGVGVLVIYQLGLSTSTIGVRDGNDVAFINWPDPRKNTIKQTFTFPAASTDRVATLVSFFAGVAGTISGGGATRPTSIEVTVNGVVTKYSNELGSVDGEEWDTWTKQILIPAGVTELSIQVFSRDDFSTKLQVVQTPSVAGGEARMISAKLAPASGIADVPVAPSSGLPASLFWLAAGLSVPDSPPPPPGDEGCTPGYWRQPQHFGNWTPPYTPSMLFADVFEDAFPGKTLLEVVWLGGGGLNALGRHTVAALLNAASGGVEYAFDATYVIQRFNEVYPGTRGAYNDLKDMWEDANEAGCPLNRAESPGDGGGFMPTGTLGGIGLRNYPNPFNPSTRIEFALPMAGPVTLTVYNIAGQQVRVLMNGDAGAGVHTVTWDARDDGGNPVPSGLYLYRLVTSNGVEVQKMHLVR